MVAALSTTPFNSKTSSQGSRAQNPKRPPLLPSETDNALAPPRRPKGREVTSRYMSTSSSSNSSNSSSSSLSGLSTLNSRRCPSPLVSRTMNSAFAMTPKPSTTLSNLKRSQSVERRKLITPRSGSVYLRNLNGGGCGVGQMSAAQKMLFTSRRSLSVSFQGESYSFPISKVKPAQPATPSVRNGKPDRRKVTPMPARGDQSVNWKTTEKQRKLARLGQDNCLSKSLDYTIERRIMNGSGRNVMKALQSSMIDEKEAVNGRLSSVSGIAKLAEDVVAVVERSTPIGPDGQSDSVVCSDSDSVSSGSTHSGINDTGVVQGQGRPRGIIVLPRFWQDINNRLHHQPESTSPFTRSMSVKGLGASKTLSIDSPASSPQGAVICRGQLSPIQGPVRPASPCKLVTPTRSSPMRGTSPARARSVVEGTPLSNLGTPSVLSFAVDIRRLKVGENRVVDAHVLRLLHNRALQWRFANARAYAALSIQRLNAEATVEFGILKKTSSGSLLLDGRVYVLQRSLYNAWLTTSRLRESIKAKRSELQLLRKNLKLTSILKEQMSYLVQWSLMDQEYCGSLFGAMEALRASTLRLPVVDGARADVLTVKDAICSAVDVMQAMTSSTCFLLSKVAQVNSLGVELVNVAAKERVLLGECKYLLSTVAGLKVKECSLRTHILQQKTSTFKHKIEE